MPADEDARGLDIACDPSFLRDSLMIIGTPTVGLTGSIVAQHLTRSLAMDEIGSVDSPLFPEMRPVKDGMLGSPVRIHARSAECGGDVRCSRLVVVTFDFRPGPPIQARVARDIITWAREAGVRIVVVPDGLPSDDDTDVFGIVNGQGAARFVEGIKVPPLDEGVCAGFTASLLIAAQRQKLDAAAVLGAAHPSFPDARASARIVSALGLALPGLKVDVGPLLEEATSIEARVRQLRESFAKAVEAGPPEEAPAAAPPMFQ